MSIFDQFSKVTKDFGNKAQEMTKDIKGKLEEQQAISRLNAQVNEAKNQMKNTYMAIGERYYELHKDDVENDMANQFQIIADAMEKIAKCEQQIRDIKNENTCPSCGATISKDVLFCPNCGTKIERPQPESEPQPTQKVCPECVAAVDEDDVFISCVGGTGYPLKAGATAEIRLSDQNVKLITFGRADQFQAIDQKLRKRQ